MKGLRTAKAGTVQTPLILPCFSCCLLFSLTMSIQFKSTASAEQQFSLGKRAQTFIVEVGHQWDTNTLTGGKFPVLSLGSMFNLFLLLHLHTGSMPGTIIKLANVVQQQLLLPHKLFWAAKDQF